MGVICSGWNLLDHWCGKDGHALDLHVAVLELPLVVLLEQDGADADFLREMIGFAARSG